MARSFRRNPWLHGGNDAPDRRAGNRRLRRLVRLRVRLHDPEADMLPALRVVNDRWGWASDDIRFLIRPDTDKRLVKKLRK